MSAGEVEELDSTLSLHVKANATSFTISLGIGQKPEVFHPVLQIDPGGVKLLPLDIPSPITEGIATDWAGRLIVRV